jgi:hypothetical protein
MAQNGNEFLLYYHSMLSYQVITQGYHPILSFHVITRYLPMLTPYVIISSYHPMLLDNPMLQTRIFATCYHSMLSINSCYHHNYPLLLLYHVLLSSHIKTPFYQPNVITPISSSPCIHPFPCCHPILSFRVITPCYHPMSIKAPPFDFLCS